MKKLFLVGLFAVAAANATVTPDLLVVSNTGPFCTANPDDTCTYEYKAELPAGHYIQSGDYFTIYDFAGYVTGSINNPAGWTGTAQLVGIDPTLPPYNGGIPDAANVYNLTWTYNGLTPINGATTLTGFMARSDLKGVAPGWYGGQTHKSGGVTVGNTPDSNGGMVDVPGPGGGDEPVVPEPMSMALFGGGLTAIGLLRLRKK